MQAAVITISAWSAHTFGVRAQGDPKLHFPGHGVLGGLVRYDAGWYVGIATDGYSLVPGHQSNVAYFPTYPLTVRAVASVIGNVVLAGITVSTIAGAVAAVLVTVWCRDRGMSPTAVATTLALVLVYPYAWYLYGVVYSDALFVALALGAAVAIGRDRVALGTLLLFLVSAARPTGICVVAGLWVVHLERRGIVAGVATEAGDGAARGTSGGRSPWWRITVHPDRVRPIDLAPLLGFGGFLSFALFLHHRFGDALAFAHVQRYWGQGTGWETLLKSQYVWEVRHLVHHSLVATTTFQALLVLSAAVMVPAVVRRFGWGYGVLQLALIGMVLVGSKDFQGSGRYLLVAFPTFAVIGEQLSSRAPALRRTLIAGSAITLFLMVAMFGHGMYLA